MRDKYTGQYRQRPGKGGTDRHARTGSDVGRERESSKPEQAVAWGGRNKFLGQ